MKDVFKKYKVVWIALVFSLVVEILVCNYGFFRTLMVENKQEVEYTVTEKANQIKIDNIDQRVTSIRFYYQKPLSRYITYEVTIVTEDRNEPITLNTKTISPKDKQGIQLDTRSKCKSMEVTIAGEGISSLGKVQINQPIFRLNSLRVILLFLGAIIFLKIKEGSFGKVEYDKNSKSQKKWDIFILAILCMILTIYITAQIDPYKFILSPSEIGLSSAGGSIDCVSMQAEAFANGQVELLVSAPKELRELSNPYDISLRQEKKVNYLYDTAYYNGKYYNYFGVAPILTSILPFRLLTGNYLPLYVFNLLYMFIAIFALYALYRKLVHRYIRKVSRLNFLLGFFAILLASNFLVLIRGLKYDIVIASGIAFLLIALNLAISIKENTKARTLKLVLLGISTGLVVLSKPNLICYYLFIIYFFWNSIQGFEKKDRIKSIVTAMIPLVLFGILQMILNYLRFDNILEFGAKYQLTVDDMRNGMNITFGKIFEGFVLYLGKMPEINLLKFPFFSLSTKQDFFIMNEWCYEQPLIGLAYIPIFYIYFFAKEILKHPKEKELKHLIILCAITAAIAIIFTNCFGGIMEYYSIDFKLILAIGAVLLMLKAIEQKEGKKWINKAFHLVCIVTIVMMLPIGLFTHLPDWGKQPITVFFENMFEFWK